MTDQSHHSSNGEPYNSPAKLLFRDILARGGAAIAHIEAYMINGYKELAVKNYEWSLELSPNNTNAVEMIKKLQNR